MHQRRAVIDLADRVVDQALDFLGGGGRALGEGTHFAGDHGEATALFAGTGGFHRSVQRQDVGLESDAVDDRDDFRDLLRRGLDGRHGGDHLADHFAALRSHTVRADGELVGLARVFGVLANGGGQFLHRSGGFFQVRGLLFGTARQVAVAGGDLAGGRADRAAGLLDAGDDLAQLSSGGVGIVTHAGEHALVVAVHAHGQVTLRQCGKQAGDLLDAARVGVQQAVDLLGQLQEEAFLVVGIDAAGQVAGSGLGDYPCHFCLDLRFLGAVAPFHHVADGVAVFVADGRHDLGELGIAVLHRAAGNTMLLEVGQQGVVHLATVLEHGDRLADQRGVDVEVGQVAAQLVLVLGQGLLQGAVAVDDGVVGVGQVDAGRAVIQRGADAQVLAGDGLVGFGALAQVALHALHGLHQFAHFVLAADVDMTIKLATGDVVGHRDGATHAADQGAGEQPHQHQAERGTTEQGDHGQHGRGGVGGGGFVARGAGEAVVFGDQRFQRGASLAVLGTGLADEGIDRVVGQVQFQHFGDAVIGGQRVLPVLGERFEQLLLLGVVDQLRIVLDRGVHAGAQFDGLLACVGLDVVAGADQLLVGAVAVLTEHAAHFAGHADAFHA
ncbi:hypothetical protein D3C75_458260 [compost metagenome]